MTNENMISSDLCSTEGSSEPAMDCTVGYRRPPLHTRFKPGRSGNPKGRPKVVRNLKSERKAIYTDLVPVRVGGEIRKIPRVLAVDIALLHRGIKGDPRAAQLADKHAKELGVYDEPSPEPTGNPLDFSDEEMEKLSDDDLETVVGIINKVKALPG